MDKFLGLDRELLLDQFFLSLHTSIRLELANKFRPGFESPNLPILEMQFNRCTYFLRFCIQKDNDNQNTRLNFKRYSKT